MFLVYREVTILHKKMQGNVCRCGGVKSHAVSALEKSDINQTGGEGKRMWEKKRNARGGLNLYCLRRGKGKGRFLRLG